MLSPVAVASQKQTLRVPRNERVVFSANWAQEGERIALDGRSNHIHALEVLVLVPACGQCANLDS